MTYSATIWRMTGWRIYKCCQRWSLSLPPWAALILWGTIRILVRRSLFFRENRKEESRLTLDTCQGMRNEPFQKLECCSQNNADITQIKAICFQQIRQFTIILYCLAGPSSYRSPCFSKRFNYVSRRIPSANEIFIFRRVRDEWMAHILKAGIEGTLI